MCINEGAPRRVSLGILALQGAFEEHEACFRSLPEELVRQLDIRQVRTVPELEACDSLVIPGGESTTMKIIAGTDTFMDSLRRYVLGGKATDGTSRPAHPVWGTCAGCILLSRAVVNGKGGGGGLSGDAGLVTEAKRCKYGDQIGGIDISSCRNFFGRQTESFEAPVTSDDPTLDADAAGRRAFDNFPAVFIRAPAILDVGEGVRVLARVRHPSRAAALDDDRGAVVAAASDMAMVTCFHPELVTDLRVHQYFVEEFVLKKATATAA